MKKQKIQILLLTFAILLGIRFFPDFMVLFLILPPVLLSFQNRSISIAFYDLNFKILKTSLFWGGLFSVVLFTVGLPLTHLFLTQVLGWQFSFLLNKEAILFLLSQILLVSFPEEFYFRGFLQDQMNRWYPSQKNYFGAPFGKAQILNALVFALAHSVISFQIWHLSIFFPALLFAWLKEKTQTIWASVFFHGVCNYYSFLIFTNYLS